MSTWDTLQNVTKIAFNQRAKNYYETNPLQGKINRKLAKRKLRQVNQYKRLESSVKYGKFKKSLY